MTYLGAAAKADDAVKKGRAAYAFAKGDAKDSLEFLGQAVALLSEAVAELARTMHQESD